jgi:hypothetical protein
VERARHANYYREHEVPDALGANNPIQATDLQIMRDQELLGVPSTTKTMALPMTFTLSLLLTLHQQARERSQFPSILMTSPHDQIPQGL